MFQRGDRGELEPGILNPGVLSYTTLSIHCYRILPVLLIFSVYEAVEILAYLVTSLEELASKAAVKHASILRAYHGVIPPTLYHSLLLASIKTNRVLSIRVLLSSWPLEEMCLANCAELTPEHASMMAHCFQKGCNKLRVIDLSSCNTGVQGTKLLLRLATGRTLPEVNEYGISNGQSQNITIKAETDVAAIRLLLKTDCYIDRKNVPWFLEMLDNVNVHDFNVTCLNAVELGLKQIKKLLEGMIPYQAQFVCGLNFEMNDLRFSSIWLKHNYFAPLNNFCHLKYLNLSGNIIGEFAVFMILKNIADGVYITHLLLNSCGIGLEKHHISKISELQCVQKLEHLELANNRLKSLDYNIMNWLEKCSSTLVYLNLEMNGLTSEDSLPAIHRLLQSPFQLKKLRVCYNKKLDIGLHQLNRSLWHIIF